MAECLKEITLESLWNPEISGEIKEEYFIHDRVVPLNCMVRECYLNHLRQVLINNLSMCSDSSNVYTNHDIERCAGLLELRALRFCMVTSLYQKAMVEVVADIKQHTKQSKPYEKLQKFIVQNCSCKINKCKATQTNPFEFKVNDNINCGEDVINCVAMKTENSPTESVEVQSQPSLSGSSDVRLNGSRVPGECLPISVHLTAVASSAPCEVQGGEDKCEDSADLNDNTKEAEKGSDNSNEKNLQEKGDEYVESCTLTESAATSYNSNNKENNISSNNAVPAFQKITEEEESMKQLNIFLSGGANKSEFGEAFLYDTATEDLIRILESEDELNEEQVHDCESVKETTHTKCTNNSADKFWKTERLCQKKKLHDRISRTCCNPEAKIKMKNKFFDIFGFDSDEDDAWCSKKKIAKYKQRIAPTIVKYLLPYYRQKRILGRQVFKLVAGHITDKLVSINHLPEESDIDRGITLFFSYHGFVGKIDDIWTGWDEELRKK